MLRTFWIIAVLILTANSSQLFALELSLTQTVQYNNQQPYLELYTRFFSKDITFTQLDDNYQAKLQVLFLINQGDQIVIADKSEISSPLSAAPIDFWDIKRFELAEGSYELKLVVNDLNQPSSKAFELTRSIEIKAPQDPFFISEPLLLTEAGENKKLPFEKHNFRFEPLAYNLVSDQEKLLFYAESYRASKEEIPPYYVSYAIHEGIDDETVGEELLKSYKRIENESYLPILGELNISELASGNYTLILEACTKDKQVIDQRKKVFSIFNPLVDLEKSAVYNSDFENSFVQIMSPYELNYGLRAMYPIVTNDQIEVLNQVLDSDNIKTKKYFIYAYWARLSPDNPELIHNKYMEVAKAVDNQFMNSVGHGFETEMGYIFLKYGKPDDIISVEDEPAAPPYQIWIYNQVALTKQNNVKFLFYNPSLGTNDYKLLHSTCRGERFNARWEVDLYSEAPNEMNDNTIDANRVSDNWNRNARRYFEDN